MLFCRLVFYIPFWRFWEISATFSKGYFFFFFFFFFKIVYRQIWNLSYRVLQVTERQITSQFGKKTKTKTKETTGCKIINRTYKYQKYSVIARYLKVTICP